MFVVFVVCCVGLVGRDVSKYSRVKDILTDNDRRFSVVVTVLSTKVQERTALFLLGALNARSSQFWESPNLSRRLFFLSKI